MGACAPSASLEGFVAETLPASTTRADVALFGFVRDLGAPTRVSLELAGQPSVRDVLEALVARHGEQTGQRLFSAAGGLQPGVTVFVGGHSVGSLDERLPEAPQVAVKIVVLHTAAGG
jgi:hypothetical protein